MKFQYPPGFNEFRTELDDLIRKYQASVEPNEQNEEQDSCEHVAESRPFLPNGWILLLAWTDNDGEAWQTNVRGPYTSHILGEGLASAYVRLG